MAADIVIEAQGLAKAYAIYARPEDRVKQVLWGRRGRLYEEFWALRGIDLKVGRGETLGIIGRNGSGKSTLLQLIYGTVAPSAGTLAVRGRVAGLLELGAGFHPEFSGRENVYMSAAIMGLSRRQTDARFDAIAEFAGIGAFIEQPVKHYSSGMYARLAFAVFAHADPEILLVDEILAVGDAAFQRKCWRFLQEFRRRGTLLFVSHDAGAVVRLCDRALWLEQGEVRAQGRSREIYEQYLSAPVRGAQRRDGASGARRSGKRQDWVQPPPPPLAVDLRAGLLPAFENRIEIGAFDRDAPWHGHGGALIEEVSFHDAEGYRLAAARGGDEVELRIACRADRTLPLAQAIVGFILRDRLGQNLFGDNTYLAFRDDPRVLAPGQAFTTRFRFQLPYFPTGLYTLAPSIIEGSQEDHVHAHWIEEAVILRAVSSHVGRSAIGVPMEGIALEVMPERQAAV